MGDGMAKIVNLEELLSKIEIYSTLAIITAKLSSMQSLNNHHKAMAKKENFM